MDLSSLPRLLCAPQEPRAALHSRQAGAAGAKLRKFIQHSLGMLSVKPDWVKPDWVKSDLPFTGRDNGQCPGCHPMQEERDDKARGAWKKDNNLYT